MSSSIVLSLTFFEIGLSLSLELTDWLGYLPSKQVPGILLSLPPSYVLPSLVWYRGAGDPNSHPH